jgi:ABC-type nitrate/sulfonate/bicarbonate transport system ATPase subunit
MTKGDIRVDGTGRSHRHNIAFVFQEPSAIPWLT